MGSRGQIVVLAAALALAALGASAAEAAGLRVFWLESGNRTTSARKITSVDRIVIHVTEGSFWGSVRWLRNNRSRGSAHYVVSRGGDVVQLVSTSNVAWHAGAAEGPHELVVYARTAGGRRAARIVPVVVANGDLPPTLDLALDAPVSDAIALP